MSNETKTIALAAYPGMSLLELVGMYSTLVGIQQKRGYRLHVVASQTGPVQTETPLPVIADKSFDELRSPAMLFVTGSGPTIPPALYAGNTLDYIRAAAQTAELVGSTGTGSLALGKAGLLTGKAAATHWMYAQELELEGARYVRDPWVEDERLITGAGVSSGADMGLHLVDKYAGRSFAKQLQLLAEYDPQPPFGKLDWEAADPNTFTATLRESSQTMMPPERKQIAFVLYPGLTPLDLAGPLGVLATMTRFAPQYETVVVAERAMPIRSDNGLTFVPNKTFEQLPHPYAVLVPGGGDPTIEAIFHPAIRKYVRTAAQDAHVVASVCTGSLILAGAGLLKGQPATTHWAFARVLERLGSPYRRQRWIENGKFFHAAGVLAGIDGALALTARLTDEATARRVQLAILYDPHPPFGGIDWSRLNLVSRMYRGYYSLKAPWIARRARRLLRRGE